MFGAAPEMSWERAKKRSRLSLFVRGAGQGRAGPMEEVLTSSQITIGVTSRTSPAQCRAILVVTHV